MCCACSLLSIDVGVYILMCACLVFSSSYVFTKQPISFVCKLLGCVVVSMSVCP